MWKIEKSLFFRQNGFKCIRYGPDRFQTTSRTPEHGFGQPYMPRMNFYTFFEIQNFDHKIDFIGIGAALHAKKSVWRVDSKANLSLRFRVLVKPSKGSKDDDQI